MKFTNKQALNLTLVAGDNKYTPTANSEIRAFTVFNPTDANIELVVRIATKQYIKKTVTAGATDTVNQLLNQQLKPSEDVVVTGEGLNVLMTVVEITE